jgi:hypothetical protein
MKILIALAALLWLGQPATAAPWQRASSAHFIIYAQQSEKTLKAYAEKLERFDAALRYLFPVAAEDETAVERLTIYALPSAQAVQKVMGKGSSGIAGVYQGRITGSIALTSADGFLEDDLTLLHEYAHHFMLHNFPIVYPRWFVEGFAEFVSTARVASDGGVGIGYAAQHRSWTLSDDPVLPIADMVADKLTKMDRAKIESMYAYGWLLTHYLYVEPKAAGQLGTYLRGINGGQPTGEAATKAFGDPKSLYANLKTYLHRPTLYHLQIPAEKVKPGPVKIETLSPGEQAAIPVRIESKYGVDRAEAERLVVLARAAAAPYPDDVAAQTMLAEAEDDAKNFDAADAAADRALKADPNAFWGLIYKGRIALQRAIDRKAAPGDKGWAEARAWFLKANKVDAEHPLPLLLFYRTYAEAHVAPTQNAMNALVAAALKAPQDDSARITAAIALLHEKRAAEAKLMLRPVAYSPHGEGDSPIAAIYARIDSDPPAALSEELSRTMREAAEKAAHPPAGDGKKPKPAS